jgi:Resolvase, N terminal domain
MIKANHRVAIYLRVSTLDQTTANQERELREVASRMGCEIVKVYRDHGVSGAKGRDERPQFDRLCRDATPTQASTRDTQGGQGAERRHLYRSTNSGRNDRIDVHCRRWGARISSLGSTAGPGGGQSSVHCYTCRNCGPSNKNIISALLSQSPLSGVQRKTFARFEDFGFWTQCRPLLLCSYLIGSVS